jgi:hypothetical protein
MFDPRVTFANGGLSPDKPATIRQRLTSRENPTAMPT